MSIYWRCIRPGLLLTALFSMTVAALTADRPPPWPRLAHTLLGTALLMAGATVMNQLMERRQDAKMDRTASRPLPTGRLGIWQAVVLAASATIAGIGYLAAMAPPMVAILAAVNWGVYVLIYTPLKRLSVWHLAIGAVAGGMPVLLGTATADATFAPLSPALFGIIFFWQFPHTSAVGWIYRRQYASGAIKVAAVVDPSGRLAGRLAMMGAAGLLLTSLIPAMLSAVGRPYVAIALPLGLIHLSFAVVFLNKPSDSNARALWRMSLIHLPVLLTSLLLAGSRLAP